MQSSPRTTMTALLNDLELRLKELQTKRIRDESGLAHLEAILNEASNHLSSSKSSQDSTLVVILLPSLVNIIFSLYKICTERCETIVLGPDLPREKLQSLATASRTVLNQMKEFLKSSPLYELIKLTEQRPSLDQLRLVADSTMDMDISVTCICHKLIVRILVGSDDQQQTQRQANAFKFPNINDGLIPSVYASILRCLRGACEQYTRSVNKAVYSRIYGLCFQMISRLISSDKTLCEMENYQDFLEIVINTHAYLEFVFDKENFQLEFFSQTITLQDILQHFLLHALTNSPKLFFDQLFLLCTTHPSKYACFIVFLRIIEAFDTCLTKQPFDQSMGIIHQLITHLFSLMDHCQIPFTLPVLLPQTFGKTPVEYQTIYDITYSFLMKFFRQQSMQTVVSSMTKLIESFEEQTSYLSTSNQLASEVIVQAWFTFHPSNSYRDLYALFLAHLLRLDAHSNLINRLLTMPNSRSVKYRTYEMLSSSSDLSHRIEDLFLHLTENEVKECLISSTNFPCIYPTNIEHLYSFVRLFQTELSSSQLQHTVDTCIYSIQQFLSLPLLTESTCQHFQRSIKVLAHLPKNLNNVHLKGLLGQLTQMFTILDDQAALDIRLELLHLFTNHCSLLDDQDLSRLLDFLLTYPIESNANSIAFHLACLNLLDSLRQKQNRSPNLTDLIIQLIVRYGNEHQCNHLLKAHLMRIFLAYISNGNDEALPTSVKSQCILLRASIDEFEKTKQMIRATNERYPYENIRKIFNSITPRKDELMNNNNERPWKFYQRIVDELGLQQCSIERQQSNAMQED